MTYYPPDRTRLTRLVQSQSFYCRRPINSKTFTDRNKEISGCVAGLFIIVAAPANRLVVNVYGVNYFQSNTNISEMRRAYTKLRENINQEKIMFAASDFTCRWSTSFDGRHAKSRWVARIGTWSTSTMDMER